MYVFCMVKSLEKGKIGGRGGRMVRVPGEGRETPAGIFRTTALSFVIRAMCDGNRAKNSVCDMI
jgi:hypothetical protein